MSAVGKAGFNYKCFSKLSMCKNRKNRCLLLESKRCISKFGIIPLFTDYVILMLLMFVFPRNIINLIYRDPFDKTDGLKKPSKTVFQRKVNNKRNLI